jgi:hypothetical protein
MSVFQLTTASYSQIFPENLNSSSQPAVCMSENGVLGRIKERRAKLNAASTSASTTQQEYEGA